MKKTIRDVDLAGKRVLVRVDYNVPVGEPALGQAARRAVRLAAAPSRTITDNTRIRETLPTLRHLQDAGCRIVVVSHLGRPDGKRVPTLSLEPVARELERLLGATVAFAHDTIGPDARAKVEALEPGGLLLLENVRFHPEEERNDPAFARELARLGEVFVNDAFATAHRAHASTAGVAQYLPAVAGFLMAKELEALGRVLEDPERPLAAVIGGAKVSTKISVLDNLLPRVDTLIIGGGMAGTFMLAKGLEVGRSLVEPDRVELARDLMQRAKSRHVSLLLPEDGVCARSAEDGDPTVTVDVSAIPADLMMVDIGPRTIAAFSRAIGDARTILWNGPMGVFEHEPFAAGTIRIGEAIASSGATTVVGGGDTVAAIERYLDPARYTHVSTGGGASLEFLEGRTLPGVAALGEKYEA